MDAAPASQTHVSVDVQLDVEETCDVGQVAVPASVAELGARGRAELTLEILDGAMRALAPARGWNEPTLAATAEAVRRDDLELVWHGPWKASPDRRHEARGTFWFEDDGYGRAVIELRSRRDGGAVARSPVAVAFCTVAGFQRSARTLRWHSREVAMIPCMGLLGGEGELRWGVDDGDAATVVGRRPTDDEPVAMPATRVTTSRRLPDEPEIRFLGGGPTNGVPAGYVDEFSDVLERLEETGAAWWSASDRTLLEISYEITDAETCVRVRRLQPRVTAVIKRARSTFRAADPEQLARDDARALIDAVARRMGLPELSEW